MKIDRSLGYDRVVSYVSCAFRPRAQSRPAAVICCLVASVPSLDAAMRLLWERAKLLVEPSAAVPFAVALSAEFKALEGLKRIAIVLSGGNADLERLPWNSGEHS